MNLNRHSILLGLLLLGGGPVAAAEMEFTLQPESVIQLDGWRTIHSWSAQTREVSGQWRTDTNWLIVATNSIPAPVESRLTISIPASSLKGKQGDSLDGRLIRHYIKSEEQPTIRFALEHLTLTNALPQPTPTWDFTAQGWLTLAGVTNSLTFPARLTQPEATQLRVIGTTELNLKDFGIEPPLVQPADKSHPSFRIFNDEVKLTFDLVFTHAAESSGARK